MSQRSDSRGSPAANSTRLALRTCSMVATRTASLSRCVLRCFGSRFASSALMPSVQTTIPFTWAMARSHVRANTESLHHTQLRPVNSSSQKLMDGEEQDLKLGAKQIFPPLLQITEHRFLMRQQLVQTPIQRIVLCKPRIFSQKIAHRAALKPRPM